MPRRVVRARPAVLVGTVLGICGCAAQTIRPTGNTQEIAVTIGCAGNSLGVDIEPWRRRIPQGDALQWTLNVTSGQVSDFKVEAKDRVWHGLAKHWPYKDSPSRVSEQIPVRYAEMRDRPNRSSYPYKISFVCTSGNEVHRVVIDPDVVVD